MSEAQQEVITAAEVRAVESERKSLLVKFAEKYGLEPNRMMATLKATAFKGDVSNEQMAALLIVADQHGLNPWCREIYAFPSRQGIVPVVGVDGWARIINEHPQFDGMDFEQDDEKCTCTIHRKDRSHPTAVTEYMTECRKVTTEPTAPWNTHPKRMLRHKAMIQCARIAFSFAGIYDPDEAERVVAAEAIDVTPGHDYDDQAGQTKKVSPKRLRKIVEGMNEAVKNEDGVGLLQIHDELESEELLFVWSQLRSWERSAIKALLDTARAAAEQIPDPKYIAPIPTVESQALAVKALQGAKTADDLKTVWRDVQAAYLASNTDMPLDLETAYIDRRDELGKP